MNEKVLSAKKTFAQLYDEFLDKVFRYLQYRVNNMQLAEDLTSSVFEKALVNFGKFSNDKASFSTWIFSIARNLIIDHYRASSKRRTVPLEDIGDQPSDALSPQELLENKDERERLKFCLARLTEEERELVRLKFGAELNNRQIGRMLNLTESNVGTKLYRAIRKMRDSYQEPGNG